MLKNVSMKVVNDLDNSGLCC